MRITVPINISSPGGGRIETNAVVDTGATFLTLPLAWKKKLPGLTLQRDGRTRIASGETVACQIAAPITLGVAAFPPIMAEAAFIEMGKEEIVWLGHIPLEAISAIIDMDRGELHAGVIDALGAGHSK